MMGMFKAKLRFGNIVFMVETKEQWISLVEKYGNITMDEFLKRLYVGYLAKLEEVV